MLKLIVGIFIGYVFRDYIKAILKRIKEELRQK